MLGEKFMWGKVMLFETCDRVPLIIRAPGQTTPGACSEGLVELVDLFPTLSALCGVEAPSNLQGRSLVSMLLDPTVSGKQIAYTVVTRGDRLGKAVRTDRWRYTRWPTGEELYDLTNDPQETTNLASSGNHADVLVFMGSRLEQVEAMAVSQER